jgi:hypothetical protein
MASPSQQLPLSTRPVNSHRCVLAAAAFLLHGKLFAAGLVTSTATLELPKSLLEAATKRLRYVPVDVAGRSSSVSAAAGISTSEVTIGRPGRSGWKLLSVIAVAARGSRTTSGRTAAGPGTVRGMERQPRPLNEHWRGSSGSNLHPMPSRHLAPAAVDSLFAGMPSMGGRDSSRTTTSALQPKSGPSNFSDLPSDLLSDLNAVMS